MQTYTPLTSLAWPHWMKHCTWSVTNVELRQNNLHTQHWSTWLETTKNAIQDSGEQRNGCAQKQCIQATITKANTQWRASKVGLQNRSNTGVAKIGLVYLEAAEFFGQFCVLAHIHGTDNRQNTNTMHRSATDKQTQMCHPEKITQRKQVEFLSTCLLHNGFSCLKDHPDCWIKS